MRAGQYPTFAYLAGVSGTDDAPTKPLPIDPRDPSKDIYQGFKSFPGVDGLNLWPHLIEHPAGANRSAAHAALVVTKEVVIVGQYKLLVAQNFGWDHHADNGWKMPANNSADPWDPSSSDGEHWVAPTRNYTCGATSGPGHLGTLPGIPGQLPCLFDLEAE